MPASWWSYDPVAAIYERVSRPLLFAEPAADLARLLAVSANAACLDVGCGTGAVASAIVETSPTARVTGVDSSGEMLERARNGGLSRLVRAAVPGLPFPDGAFDRVSAGFLISHLRDYHQALADMVRVLGPGGLLGVSTWGSATNEFQQMWQTTAESFLDRDLLGRATREALPWEEWFSDPGRLEAALRQAGLAGVEVHHRTRRIRATAKDFLSTRDVSFTARYLRETLGDREWARFQERVAAKLRSHSGDRIEYTRDAFFGVGRKD